MLFPCPHPPCACPGRPPRAQALPGGSAESRPFSGSPLLRRAGKGGRSPPPSSRFSASTFISLWRSRGTEKTLRLPPVPHARQPPRRPALREDAVETRYRPHPTSGNRKTPQRRSSGSFQGAGRDLLRSVVFQPQGESRACPPSLTPRQREARKPDCLPGPAPPRDGCIRAARPSPPASLQGPLKQSPCHGDFLEFS